VKYEQFCPVAKASEVLTERWTVLVVRELLAGATRFSQLQRGLGRISPSVLTERLKSLVDHGVVERTPAESGAGVEYRLTAAGAELAPIVESIGVWGQRWVRSRMTREELDVELLMLHMERALDVDAFPQAHAVVAFVFSGVVGDKRRWWILVDDGRKELCMQAPGRSEDVRLSCSVRTLAELFVGDTTLPAAIAEGRLVTEGTQRVIRSLPRWLRPSPFAAVPPAGR